MKKISMIAALTDEGVIGCNGTLPWHLPKDFAWFVKNTTNKIVVMGRKNYEDIIRFTKGKPLKDRVNVILTSQNIAPEGFIVVHSIDELFSKFSNEDLMVIGGSQIYEQFLPYADELILTEIHQSFKGDSFFPTFDKKDYVNIYLQEEEEKGIAYDFCIYKKK